MSILDPKWSPTRKQRKQAEIYIHPLVKMIQFLTSWPIMFLAFFMLPLLAGESVLYSAVLGSITGLTSYYIWKDPSEIKKG